MDEPLVELPRRAGPPSAVVVLTVWVGPRRRPELGMRARLFARPTRGDLVAENLLLRQQIAILTRPTCKRPRLRARDRLFWMVVGICRRDWPRHLVLARPESVVRWHRQGWRLFWRWKSRCRLAARA